MVRQAQLMADGGVFLVGRAVLVVVGCAGVRSAAPKEQEHTEATKEQECLPRAAASKEARCEKTQTFHRPGFVDGWVYRGTYTTNDVSGCTNGGLLSDTEGPDKLYGGDGGDEVRAFGAADELQGASGSDVLYGGRDADVLYGEEGDDVLYGGDGDDNRVSGGKGEDVIYGGDGDDFIYADDRQRDKLYCGEGWTDTWLTRSTMCRAAARRRVGV